MKYLCLVCEEITGAWKVIFHFLEKQSPISTELLNYLVFEFLLIFN